MPKFDRKMLREIPYKVMTLVSRFLNSRAEEVHETCEKRIIPHRSTQKCRHQNAISCRCAAREQHSLVTYTVNDPLSLSDAATAPPLPPPPPLSSPPLAILRRESVREAARPVGRARAAPIVSSFFQHDLSCFS